MSSSRDSKDDAMRVVLAEGQSHHLHDAAGNTHAAHDEKNNAKAEDNFDMELTTASAKPKPIDAYCYPNYTYLVGKMV